MPLLLLTFAFTVDLLIGCLTELRVNGEPYAPFLWALFVLPFDSSQARSFASMSTLPLGVSSFLVEETKLET